jgi:sugar transferase (PEP-CTERM/EpsH1 system associated)
MVAGTARCMQILFVVPYVPNLVRVRPFNFIRQLSKLGHQVTVATLWTDQQDQADIQDLRQHCHAVEAVHLPPSRTYWNCVQALPQPTPLQAVYCWQPSLLARLAPLIGGVDVIHVEHLRGTPFALELKAGLARANRQVPIVWDSVDCITHLFRQASNRSTSRLRRWLMRFEVSRTEKHESWLVNQFNRVLVTSPVERVALLSLLRATPAPLQIKVLRNGVDLDYFQPGEEATRQPDTIVVSGKMSYHANIAMVAHFALNILPLIWARRPKARLVIVGQDPPREIRRLGTDNRITVVGTVRDMRPHLRQAAVAVAPLTYGAGIQNKVLEAMACATPVVASPQAVSALDVELGREVMVAREPAAFAEAVAVLLEDPERQRQMGEAGRCFVERQHRWVDVVTQLERTYDELVGARN